RRAEQLVRVRRPQRGTAGPGRVIGRVRWVPSGAGLTRADRTDSGTGPWRVRYPLPRRALSMVEPVRSGERRRPMEPHRPRTPPSRRAGEPRGTVTSGETVTSIGGRQPT